MARAAQTTYPRREEGEGSGVYIRRLLTDWSDDTDAILEAVHAQFEGSRAKASDVSWNRGILKKEADNGAPAVKTMKAKAMPAAVAKPRGRPRKEATA
jgi:hypothetical protein